jgi:hypothetical protein
LTYTQDCHFDEEIRQVICEDVPVYQDVTLTAATHSGWSWLGWGGACSGTGTCTVTMDDDKSVSATFSDVQAPSVSLTSPSGSSVTGTINVQATASDNNQVSSVQFFVGATSLGTDTTAPYGVSFNTVGHDGSRQFRAVATDLTGRTAEASRTVMVDNTPPTLTVNSGPNSGIFGPDSTQTWTFSAGDNHSGLASVQCSVVTTGSAPSFGPCSGGSASHSVSNRPDGNYTFTVRARDNVDFETTSSRTFSIDATAPNTRIDSGIADGRATNQTSLTFNFSASETGSTFECRVYPAALTPPTFGDCSGNGTHTSSGFTQGKYSFEVRATDARGNLDQTPAKRTFKVDTAGPRGSVLINGGKASTRNRTVTLTLQANDPAPDSGVPSMRIANSSSALATAAWKPFARSKSWTLSGGGSKTKTVFVQYRDGAGNVSAVVRDSIRYRR